MSQYMNPDLMNEIKRRISKDLKWISTNDYHGFRMNKTHSQDEENKLITTHNEKVIDLFKDHLESVLIKNCFDCWKGECFFAIDKNYNNLIKSFGGWCSEDIIRWLIEYGKEQFWEKIQEDIPKAEKKIQERENIFRIITYEQRYDILKRQKWRCNQCGTRLKYKSNSQFGKEVAHIDHIFPFSDRKNYPNGIENINELSNLQALCPNCNLKKGKKKTQ